MRDFIHSLLNDGRTIENPVSRQYTDASSCPWKKSSLTFFHSADRRKRRGFPGSTTAASSGGYFIHSL